MYCSTCGQQLTGGRFCSGCGADSQQAHQGSAPEVAPAPNTDRPAGSGLADPSGKTGRDLRGRRFLWAGVGLLVVALIATTATLVLKARASGDGSGLTTEQSQSIDGLLGPVVGAQAQLNAAVEAPNSAATIRELINGTNDAIDSALTGMEGLQIPRDVRSSLEGVLRQHRDLDNSMDSAVSSAPRQLIDLDSARLSLAMRYAGLDFVSPKPALTNSFEGLSQRLLVSAELASKVKAFYRRLDQLLTQSVSGRGEIISSISATQRCELAPEQAARQIESVAENRQSLLDQVNALNAPTASTRALLNELHNALVHSREADRQFALWVRNESDWYYTQPVGCLGGDMPVDAAHARAGDESGLASAAKQRFVSKYNPSARKYGLRTRSAGEI